MDSYWPESTLADLLDIHVANYAHDFRRYWQLDASEPPGEIAEEDWRLARLLDLVGSKVVVSARALRVHPELEMILREHRPWEEPLAAATDLTGYAIAQSRAEIELAGELVGRLFEGKRRLALVLLLLSRFRLSERAAAYTDRMIQCYILGLDTEMTVMARSVLEAALEEAFSDAEMAALGFKQGKYGFAFWQYRDAAARSRRLDKERLEDIEAVRRAGNDAVHATPGLHPGAIATLARTVMCLRALLPDAGGAAV